eukprot:923683-Prorocentrum_minimum.AAC.2
MAAWSPYLPDGAGDAALRLGGIGDDLVDTVHTERVLQNVPHRRQPALRVRCVHQRTHTSTHINNLTTVVCQCIESSVRALELLMYMYRR